MSLLAELEARISGMAPSERAELEKLVASELKQKWSPLPGPQTDAMRSKADVLLYGGQGGGGKTDLGIGLAFTEHKRSLILRRKYVNLGALTDRALEINGSRDGYNGSPPPSIRTADGRLIQFAGCQHLGDEQDWQGQPFDLKVFDEATQFLQQMVRFHLGWLRTTEPGQRTRALLATNPPVDASGEWIIGMFRPWLDPMHPNPAKHGELRWYVTAPDGSDLEVDGPQIIQLPGSPTPSVPTSRSFVPAALRDNPYLIDTGYQAQLDALPEPTRSAVRDGNFMLARGDDEWQVIPSAHIRAAQERWTDPRTPMLAMGVDVAQGGADSTEIAPLHVGNTIGRLISRKGIDTKDGPAVASLILRERRDGALIAIDMSGGWGGSARDHLRTNNDIECVAVVFGSGSHARDKQTGMEYANLRAEMYWDLRTALDPSSGENVALPPGEDIVSHLSASRWTTKGGKILIESKDEIRKRLGSSPDKADAIVMAWHIRNRAARAASRRILGGSQSMPARANVGNTNMKTYRR